MATTVHIPLEELSVETRALLDRARESGEVYIDGHGVRYKISRMPGRTAAEALQLLEQSPQSDVELDEDWDEDMREITALRKTEPVRDPWE